MMCAWILAIRVINTFRQLFVHGRHDEDKIVEIPVAKQGTPVPKRAWGHVLAIKRVLLVFCSVFFYDIHLKTSYDFVKYVCVVWQIHYIILCFHRPQLILNNYAAMNPNAHVTATNIIILFYCSCNQTPSMFLNYMTTNHTCMIAVMSQNRAIMTKSWASQTCTEWWNYLQLLQ